MLGADETVAGHDHLLCHFVLAVSVLHCVKAQSADFHYL